MINEDFDDDDGIVDDSDDEDFEDDFINEGDLNQISHGSNRK